MPAGRPTKYTPELIAKCYEYMEKWREEGDMIPSHEGLQEYVGISSACLYRWKDEEGKEEFKEILDEILTKQRRTLINGGLAGELNSNITKLVLGKHGYHDKKDVGSDPERPVQLKADVSISPEDAYLKMLGK